MYDFSIYFYKALDFKSPTYVWVLGNIFLLMHRLYYAGMLKDLFTEKVRNAVEKGFNFYDIVRNYDKNPNYIRKFLKIDFLIQNLFRCFGRFVSVICLPVKS